MSLFEELKREHEVDRSLDNIFAIQDEIAAVVVAKLKIGIAQLLKGEPRVALESMQQEKSVWGRSAYQ